jgi:capsular polysaccharide biosynthesis protein
MNENKERKLEVTVRDVFNVLIKKWLIIVLCGLVLASSFLLGTKLFITPQYESTTKMFVLYKINTGFYQPADFQMSTMLTQDYAQVIKSRTVAEQVIENLGLDMSTNALRNRITVETDDNTRIVTIIAKDPDPVMAQKLADEIRQVSATQIVDVMDMEAVNVVDTANLPTPPSTPKTAQNTLLGGALGFVLAAAIILLQHYSNDTIKNTDDVEHYLGLNVLASIPTNEPNTKKKKRGVRK